MRLLRRPSLPRDVAALFPRADRPVAFASLANGGWAIATQTALVVAGADGVEWRRPWHEVDRGAWDEATSAITSRWVDGSDAALELAPSRRRRLLEALRERVQSSVVHVERLELPGGVVIRAVIRRAEDGSLLSQVLGDGPVPVSAQPQIETLEARSRRAVGLPG